jgi:hypothetical protein
MSYTYTSLEDGQVIHSDDKIDYLEGLARWVRTEGDDKAAPKKAPAKKAAPKAAHKADDAHKADEAD